MAQSIAGAWRDFWHTMTSNDRHASHDSPYRTGQHVPLPQSRHAPLTSVATSAIESRADLSYTQDDMSNGFIGSPNGPMSPHSPYSPGMRTTLQRQTTGDETTSSLDKSGSNSNAGEIQMQSFSDGLPPPPPVQHSWKRIDRWVEDNFEELFDNLCEGCTQNDVNELEHELDMTLPMEVRESLQVHDGQERGGLPTGVIFGMMLLDCEEIVQEWNNWRKVGEEFLTARPGYLRQPRPPTKAFGAEASSSSSPPPQQAQPNGLWRQDLLARQDSQPPGAVQKAYTLPAWIPLARDWGGNYLAVDLAPGPSGKWGQIIIFGRDYDCKYVVARSWAAFLATLADDISSDKVWIDEETNELKLREFKRQNVDPPYLEILRWRCDQKYGRKGPRRRPNGAPVGLHINSNVSGTRPAGSRDQSPYQSPTSTIEDRGRSPSRFGPKSTRAAPSPRPHLSSPLARVAEEKPQPLRVHTDVTPPSKTEKLVPIDTPRPSEDQGTSSDKENNKEGEKEKGKHRVEVDEMKTVEI